MAIFLHTRSHGAGGVAAEKATWQKNSRWIDQDPVDGSVDRFGHRIFKVSRLDWLFVQQVCHATHGSSISISIWMAACPANVSEAGWPTHHTDQVRPSYPIRCKQGQRQRTSMPGWHTKRTVLTKSILYLFNLHNRSNRRPYLSSYTLTQVYILYKLNERACQCTNIYTCSDAVVHQLLLL